MCCQRSKASGALGLKTGFRRAPVLRLTTEMLYISGAVANRYTSRTLATAVSGGVTVEFWLWN